MNADRTSSTFTSPTIPTSAEVWLVSEELSSLPILDEEKMQRLISARPGTYGYHTAFFLETFLAENPRWSEEMTLWDGITFIGSPQWHDHVIYEIQPDRDLIEKTSKKKILGVFIFLGSGVQMNTLYRAIGTQYQKTKENYPLAIVGGNSCFINIDNTTYEGGLYTHQQIASYRHEFRHATTENVLDRLTGIHSTFSMDTTGCEALAGPDELFWRRAPITRVKANFDGLDNNNFFEWLQREEKSIGFNENFFKSPVVQSFYLDYVYSRGDFAEWFNKAIEIRQAAKIK